MKSTKEHRVRELLRKAIKGYLSEAEKKADDKEGGDENPFAAAADDAGGEEETKDSEGEKKDSGKKTSAQEPAGIPITFNASAAKKYNNAEFLSDKGVVKSISKDGVVVTTQPDGVDVLVNFDDISESVKRFFKKDK